MSVTLRRSITASLLLAGVLVVAACSQEGDPKDPASKPPEESELRQTMTRMQNTLDDLCNTVSGFTRSRNDIEAGAAFSDKLLADLQSSVIAKHNAEPGYQEQLEAVISIAKELDETMEPGVALQQELKAMTEEERESEAGQEKLKELRRIISKSHQTAVRIGATCEGCHRDYRDDKE
ncbi:MAG: hypothetical protein RL885_04365 [Planctomycetota bacterium]